VYIDEGIIKKFLGISLFLNTISNKFIITAPRIYIEAVLNTDYIVFAGNVYNVFEPILEREGKFYISETMITEIFSKALMQNIEFEKSKLFLKNQEKVKAEIDDLAIVNKDCFNTVVIDPGHGGEDEGAVTGQYKEKNIVLQIAKRLKTIIEANSKLKVFLTRSEDYFFPLRARTKVEDRVKANLFISIHLNSSENIKAQGYEVFVLDADTTDEEAAFIAKVENSVLKYEAEVQASDKIIIDDILADISISSYKEDSMKFAEILVKNNKLFKSRGIKQAPFVALMGLNMPSVLLEVGFISNESDREKLIGKTGQENIVTSILYSIMEFKEKYNLKYCNF